MEPDLIIADRYRVLAAVGEGGTGVVLRARDLTLDRDVAIKVLHDHLAADPQARRRFVREARVAGQLVHPGAVCILDWGSSADRLYLVMEWLDGVTLRQALAAPEPMPVAHALSIAEQVAAVLVAAHALGLVHRDLKPENVLVTRVVPPVDDSAPVARVVDFGLACLRGEPSAADLGRVTRPGQVLATFAYAAPEVLAGAEPAPAADLYALGCLLYELLIGAPPFVGTAAEVCNAQLYLPPPSPRRANPDLSLAIEELVAELLHKQPAQRPTAAELQPRLAALAASGGLAEELRPHDGRASRALPRITSSPIAISAAAPGSVAGSAPGSVPGSVPATVPGAARVRTRIGAVGVAPELAAQLAAAGFELVTLMDPQITSALVLSGAAFDAEAAGDPPPGDAASDLLLQQLIARGLAVVCDADVRDMERISALLKLGVREVVARPAQADDVLRKLARATRRRPTSGP